jgi:cytosine/adenosine deaminase-related metal-dependent hydrolase
MRSFRLVSLLACLGLVPALAGCPGPSDPDAGVRIDAPIPDTGVPIDTGAPIDTGVPVDAAMGDAGMGTTGPTITVCPGDALPSLPSGACEATAGDANLLITADVLTPGEVFRGGQVLVDAMGAIACVGCDCAGAAGASGATRISCPDGVLSPGLINAHEHLTFQGVPYTRTDERYEHRHDWRRNPRMNHTRIPSSMTEGAAETQMGELRMVLGGATAVNGSGGREGFVRNVDRETMLEALGQPAIEYQTFPLDDSDGTLRASGCSYGARRDTASEIARFEAYTPHVAEGIDVEGRNEFLCMREGNDDLVQPITAMIHGVGLLPIDMREMAIDGTMLVWSPRTNVTLYGDTARVPEYDRMGVPIALGTDWVATGSMNMLRELQCADELNATYFARHFSDEELWMMATYNGAVAMAMEDAIGVISVGRTADLAIFDARMHVDHRAVIDAEPQDVVLVLRGGRPLYGDAALVEAVPMGGTGCDTLDVCGTAKRACVMREIGTSLAALQAAANEGRPAYPLFFCGTPMNEPSCVPERNATTASVLGSTRYTGLTSGADSDGDGIANDADNCPTMFNPVRPLDMGMQADSDMDGEGDTCDVCPLDADTSTCSMVDPLDRDGDGRQDAMDNCPAAANPDQADADMDGKGDLCDACPDVANPGAMTCPITVYSIKRGIIPSGTMATGLTGVVTAVTPNGFFFQVPPTDPAYAGVDHSGIFVFTSSRPARAIGEAVSVNARVNLFSGQWQLDRSTVTAMGMGTVPAPELVPAGDIATGGPRHTALEGVLVRVEAVAVTDANPDAPRDFGEIAVTDELRIDDWMTPLTAFRTVGTSFTSITGVLAFRFSNSKINPRSPADIVSP